MRAWLRPKAPTPTTATLIKLSASYESPFPAPTLTQHGPTFCLAIGVSLRGLLQQSDLAGMIELVLDDAAEHVEEVVVVLALARDLLTQPRIGKGSHCLDQFVVSVLGGINGLAPGSIAGVFHEREILLVREGYGRAPNSSAHGIIPGGDVQKNFPDAVGVLDRPGGRRSGIHPSQQFENRVAVPGVAFKGAA